MTRLFRAFALVSVLAVVPCTVIAQKETPKNGAPPRSNQVYVKIIWPTDPAAGDKDRPVVESWIAEHLKKRGQSKFTAATEWVPLVEKRFEATRVWDGNLDGKSRGCPVHGEINERADGRIKVRVDGWAPVPGFEVTVSLKDEPGSREIVAAEKLKGESGSPYVAVFIGPPPENPAAPTAKSK